MIFENEEKQKSRKTAKAYNLQKRIEVFSKSDTLAEYDLNCTLNGVRKTKLFDVLYWHWFYRNHKSLYISIMIICALFSVTSLGILCDYTAKTLHPFLSFLSFILSLASPMCILIFLFKVIDITDKLKYYES